LLLLFIFELVVYIFEVTRTLNGHYFLIHYSKTGFYHCSTLCSVRITNQTFVYTIYTVFCLTKVNDTFRGFRLLQWLYFFRFKTVQEICF